MLEVSIVGVAPSSLAGLVVVVLPNTRAPKSGLHPSKNIKYIELVVSKLH